MAATDGTDGHYIGVVTPVQTMFHDVSAGAVSQNVGHYLVMLELSDALVLGSFRTEVAALCWLTNPLTKEAVVNASPAVEAFPGLAAVPGWLAVYNESSCAVYDVDQDGVERALAVACTVAAGVSIVRLFRTARAGMFRLSGGGPNDLHHIVVPEFPPPSHATDLPPRHSDEAAAETFGLLEIAAPPLSAGDGPGHCGQVRKTVEPQRIGKTLYESRSTCGNDLHEGAQRHFAEPTAPIVHSVNKSLCAAPPVDCAAACKAKMGIGREQRTVAPMFNILKRAGASGLMGGEQTLATGSGWGCRTRCVVTPLFRTSGLTGLTLVQSAVAVPPRSTNRPSRAARSTCETPLVWSVKTRACSRGWPSSACFLTFGGTTTR